MKIYYVTGNTNKLREAQKIIPDLNGLTCELTEIQSLDTFGIIKHKLDEAKKKFPDKNLIVEDTSLYFECLNNQLPGPYIKWFLKVLKPEGLAKLVNLHKNNRAFVKCVIGLSTDNKIEFFESLVNGQIVEPKGTKEFGWDPIFIPNGYSKTYAEIGEEEKNKISHRSLVLEKVKKYLEAESFKKEPIY